MWKLTSGALFDQGFEPGNEFLEVVRLKHRVLDVGAVTFVLQTVNDDFKGLMVLARAFLDAHDDVAIHLHETAITIPSKPLVVAQPRQRPNGLVVETQVQDGVHHARHRVPGTGTNGNEQRLLQVPELLGQDFLDELDAAPDLRVQFFRIGFLVLVIIRANVGGDGETRRNRQTNAGHFGQVGAFAAQERLHRAVPVRLLVSEQINIFLGLAHNQKKCATAVRFRG